jgi:hypothetical protein
LLLFFQKKKTLLFLKKKKQKDFLFLVLRRDAWRVTRETLARKSRSHPLLSCLICRRSFTWRRRARWLLHEFGRVVVMDVVADEASGDPAKPWALDVAAWIEKGQAPGSDQPVDVVRTEIGEAYRLARRTLREKSRHCVICMARMDHATADNGQRG